MVFYRRPHPASDEMATVSAPLYLFSLPSVEAGTLALIIIDALVLSALVLIAAINATTFSSKGLTEKI